MTIERTIIQNLIFNEDFSRRTTHFIKPDYFQDAVERVIFEEISEFINKYNNRPTKEALIIAIDEREDISSTQYNQAIEEISSFEPEDSDLDWLTDSTEKFCRDKAVYNAIMESITIIDDKTGKKAKSAIPDLLSDALAVSFDTHIGHDFLDNADERYDFYHKKEERIEFDIDYLNEITKGGVPKKTLNIFLAGPGVGKTLAMTHIASNCLTQGNNVLYITMEMAEERIAERIDANLLNVTLNDLERLPRSSYEKKIERIRSNTSGKLIVKEYPTASAHSGHFKALLKELSMKKGFVPDIIFIDYLNICASARFAGASSGVNSYTYVKAIAEELRGMAVEYNVPVFSATQTTRSGYSNTDVGLEDTSESFGLPATADMMLALISTEELVELNQVMIKQLKNRYSDLNKNKRFVVGIDKAKMRWYNVEEDAQEELIMPDEVAETSQFNKSKESKNKKAFKEFKV